MLAVEVAPQGRFLRKCIATEKSDRANTQKNDASRTIVDRHTEHIGIICTLPKSQFCTLWP